MKNYIYIPIGILIISIIVILIPRHNFHKKEVLIKIDSVFINQYKNKDTNDVMYMFVHMSICNNSKDTIKINTRYGELFKKTKDLSNFYGVYNSDTLNFYSGNYSHHLSIILPGETRSGDLEYGGIGKEILYREKYSKVFIRRVDYMRSIIESSNLYFEIGGELYNIPPGKRNIIYRNLDDDAEQTWK
jgi:hypothetical protein